jgi:Ca2+/Na+ antiporter
MLNVKDYTFMLIIFPIFSSLPDLIIIILNLIYAGSLGPGMALSAAVGEPFIIMTLGIPAVLIFNLLKYGRNDASLFTGSIGKFNEILYIPILVSIVAYAIIFFLSRIFLIISLLVILVLAFYFYFGNLKQEISENRKKASIFMAILFVLAGFFGFVIFGKMLVTSVVEISIMTKISPYSQSFVIFPLVAAMPEFFASFSLIIKGDREAATASLLGEITITSTMYPVLIFIFFIPTLTLGVILGMVFEIISAIAVIITSLKKAMLYVIPFNLALFIAYILITF